MVADQHRLRRPPCPGAVRPPRCVSTTRARPPRRPPVRDARRGTGRGPRRRGRGRPAPAPGVGRCASTRARRCARSRWAAGSRQVGLGQHGGSACRAPRPPATIPSRDDGDVVLSDSGALGDDRGGPAREVAWVGRGFGHRRSLARRRRAPVRGARAASCRRAVEARRGQPPAIGRSRPYRSGPPPPGSRTPMNFVDGRLARSLGYAVAVALSVVSITAGSDGGRPTVRLSNSSSPAAPPSRPAWGWSATRCSPPCNPPWVAHRRPMR